MLFEYSIWGSNFKLGLEHQISHKLGHFCQVGPTLGKVLGHLGLHSNRAPYMPSTMDRHHSPPTKLKMIIEKKKPPKIPNIAMSTFHLLEGALILKYAIKANHGVWTTENMDIRVFFFCVGWMRGTLARDNSFPSIMFGATSWIKFRETNHGEGENTTKHYIEVGAYPSQINS